MEDDSTKKVQGNQFKKKVLRSTRRLPGKKPYKSLKSAWKNQKSNINVAGNSFKSRRKLGKNKENTGKEPAKNRKSTEKEPEKGPGKLKRTKGVPRKYCDKLKKIPANQYQSMAIVL